MPASLLIVISSRSTVQGAAKQSWRRYLALWGTTQAGCASDRRATMTHKIGIPTHICMLSALFHPIDPLLLGKPCHIPCKHPIDSTCKHAKACIHAGRVCLGKEVVGTKAECTSLPIPRFQQGQSIQALLLQGSLVKNPNLTTLDMVKKALPDRGLLRQPRQRWRLVPKSNAQNQRKRSLATERSRAVFNAESENKRYICCPKALYSAQQLAPFAD